METKTTEATPQKIPEGAKDLRLFASFEDALEKFIDPTSSNINDDGETVYINTVSESDAVSMVKLAKEVANSCGPFDKIRIDPTGRAFLWHLSVPSLVKDDRKQIKGTSYKVVLAKEAEGASKFVLNIIKNEFVKTIH